MVTEDSDGEAVGEAMRLARRRTALSQRGLAEALGWDRAKVGRWENGELPRGYAEVVGLLRTLGFDVVLVDRHAGRWAEWDSPAEHVVDRGGRRFPAHLVLAPEHVTSTWSWVRHRSEPSPGASGMTFRRQSASDAVAEQRLWRPGDHTDPREAS